MLQVLEVADIQARDQRNGDAGLSGSAGSPRAVNVDFRRFRGRIADHVGQVADVDPPGGDVGGYQEAKSPLLDPVEGGLTRGLGEVARDLVRVETAFRQEAGEVAHIGLGVAEDDRALRIFQFDDPRQRRFLLLGGDQVEEMFDLLGSELSIGEADKLGIVEKEPGERADLFGHRGGEKVGPAFRGEVTVNFSDVGPEAEGKHLVGFVENQVSDVVQVHATISQVIDNPPRGSDDDVGSLLEGVQLRAVADAPIDGEAPNPAVGRDHGNFLGNLGRELSRGNHDQRLGLGEIDIGGFDQGNSEGTGLSAAGLGLNDQVPVPSHQGNDLALHGHGRGPAEIAHGGAQVVIEFLE